LAALLLTAVAMPPLLARLAGGRPPNPGPQLAALAPVATVPALLAVLVAAFTAWWLAVLLAIPAAVLLTWQLPPPGLRRGHAAAGPLPRAGPAPDAITVRVLSVNARGGVADPAALLHTVRRHDVDVLAIQELTPDLASRLTTVGMAGVLPFSELDPRPGSPGVGLWARWPLTPLSPVPGMVAAAPRARIEPRPGLPVTLVSAHPKAPMKGRAEQWQRDLEQLRAALVATAEPQVVAGDFNASRDHRAFRHLLAAGFLDCADAARRRPWPGFTWPTTLDFDVSRVHRPVQGWLRTRRMVPVMRLDHVLVSRAAATVREARVISIPGTDHHGVLALIEFRAGRPGSRDAA
jgi:endonuclease/exonuclease/phosphatase family metal-dependent hydrolase